MFVDLSGVKAFIGLVTPHPAHAGSVGGSRFGREEGRCTYAVLAVAARHCLQVFLRYLMPFVGVNSSVGLAGPQIVQVRLSEGAGGFRARDGRPALAQAARHGLHRVCVQGVPFIGVNSESGLVARQSVHVRITERRQGSQRGALHVTVAAVSSRGVSALVIDHAQSGGDEPGSSVR